MARPSVQHNGFLIPNAQDVSNTLLAEPDKIDFNTVANARWGVVTGCALGEQGAFALTVGSGVAVVNGELVPVRGGTVTLSQPPSGSRFINVVVDKGGNIRTLDGEATADPVYKDVPLDNTLLATAYAASDAANLQDFVVDKRHFLTPALLANVGPTADLVRNYNDPAPVNGYPVEWFRINGRGDIFWWGDITLKRKDATALTLDKRLEAEGLQAQNNIISTNGNVQASLGIIIGRNLRNAPTAPPTPGLGDLWQNTVEGVVYIGTRIGVESGEIDWQPLATADTALPVGTIIDSVEEKETMRLKGWIALDGSAISEDDISVKNLFNLTALEPWIQDPGNAPHRTMVLPDLNRRFRVTDFDDTGREGGSNYKYMTQAQMPKHYHNVRVDTHGDVTPTATLSGMSGAHTHPINGDGYHDHHVYDQGHYHGFGAGGVIATDPNGGSMVDGLINDRSHTYRCAAHTTTSVAFANIVAAGATIGELSIPYGGAHNHTVHVSAISGLYHVVRQDHIGEGEPFDVMPAYFTVRSYIRS